MKNDLPFTVYASPRTGTEYLVVANAHKRMRGGLLEGCPMYWADETKFHIMLNGHQVNHCFDEASIPDAVWAFENPLTSDQLATMHSRFD